MMPTIRHTSQKQAAFGGIIEMVLFFIIPGSAHQSVIREIETTRDYFFGTASPLKKEPMSLTQLLETNTFHQRKGDKNMPKAQQVNAWASYDITVKIAC